MNHFCPQIPVSNTCELHNFKNLYLCKIRTPLATSDRKISTPAGLHRRNDLGSFWYRSASELVKAPLCHHCPPSFFLLIIPQPPALSHKMQDQWVVTRQCHSALGLTMTKPFPPSHPECFPKYPVDHCLVICPKWNNPWWGEEKQTTRRKWKAACHLLQGHRAKKGSKCQGPVPAALLGTWLLGSQHLGHVPCPSAGPPS